MAWGYTPQDLALNRSTLRLGHAARGCPSFGTDAPVNVDMHVAYVRLHVSTHVLAWLGMGVGLLWHGLSILHQRGGA